MAKKNFTIQMRSTKLSSSSRLARATMISVVPGRSSPINRARRKASTLLIVLIGEFFICWTPLYLYHTVGVFDKTIYRWMPSLIPNLILFLSFASASCNPITYYFMSRRFRTIIYENLNRFSPRKHRSNFTSFHYDDGKGFLQLRRIKSNPI